METALKRLYEGMFLVDSALAAQDWQKVIDEIQRVLSRAQADVVSVKKWDERRLLHEVKGKTRGTYILSYFHCETDKLTALDRDIQLSEVILRALILRADSIKQEDMNKPTPAEIQPEEGGEATESGAAESAE